MTRRGGAKPGRGFFGIGIIHGKSQPNLGTLWRSAHSFGADLLFTVGARYTPQASDTTKAWRHVPLFNFTDVDDLVAHLPFACRLIGVELCDGAHALPTYKHPETACYLLGAEDHGLSPATLGRCHERIVVPAAARCLNVATAGSIVLYDRAVKVAA